LTTTGGTRATSRLVLIDNAECLRCLVSALCHAPTRQLRQSEV
jgi:hypothetical protein